MLEFIFGPIEPVQFIIALCLSLAIGVGIFFVYKHTFAGVLYSKSLAFSFVLIALVTTLVIMAVSSNVMLSLGMVGALSIVRFRAAIKEPVDIAFLFWAIAVGIVNGAGMFGIAVLGSAVIAAAILIFANVKSNIQPYVLVVSLTEDFDEAKLNAFLESRTKKFTVKTKTITDNGADITFEIRLPDSNTKLATEIKRFGFVRSAALISFNGDYAG